MAAFRVTLWHPPAPSHAIHFIDAVAPSAAATTGRSAASDPSLPAAATNDTRDSYAAAAPFERAPGTVAAPSSQQTVNNEPNATSKATPPGGGAAAAAAPAASTVARVAAVAATATEAEKAVAAAARAPSLSELTGTGSVSAANGSDSTKLAAATPAAPDEEAPLCSAAAAAPASPQLTPQQEQQEAEKHRFHTQQQQRQGQQQSTRHRLLQQQEECTVLQLEKRQQQQRPLFLRRRRRVLLQFSLPSRLSAGTGHACDATAAPAAAEECPSASSSASLSGLPAAAGPPEAKTRSRNSPPSSSPVSPSPDAKTRPATKSTAAAGAPPPGPVQQHEETVPCAVLEFVSSCVWTLERSTGSSSSTGDSASSSRTSNDSSSTSCCSSSSPSSRRNSNHSSNGRRSRYMRNSSSAHTQCDAGCDGSDCCCSCLCIDVPLRLSPVADSRCATESCSSRCMGGVPCSTSSSCREDDSSNSNIKTVSSTSSSSAGVPRSTTRPGNSASRRRRSSSNSSSNVDSSSRVVEQHLLETTDSRNRWHRCDGSSGSRRSICSNGSSRSSSEDVERSNAVDLLVFDGDVYGLRGAAEILNCCCFFGAKEGAVELLDASFGRPEQQQQQRVSCCCCSRARTATDVCAQQLLLALQHCISATEVLQLLDRLGSRSSCRAALPSNFSCSNSGGAGGSGNGAGSRAGTVSLPCDCSSSNSRSSSRTACSRSSGEAGNDRSGNSCEEVRSTRCRTTRSRKCRGNCKQLRAQFALVYYSSKLQSLFFCRDKMGARSLVVCTYTRTDPRCNSSSSSTSTKSSSASCTSVGSSPSHTAVSSSAGRTEDSFSLLGGRLCSSRSVLLPANLDSNSRSDDATSALPCWQPVLTLEPSSYSDAEGFCRPSSHRCCCRSASSCCGMACSCCSSWCPGRIRGGHSAAVRSGSNGGREATLSLDRAAGAGPVPTYKEISISGVGQLQLLLASPLRPATADEKTTDGRAAPDGVATTAAAAANKRAISEEGQSRSSLPLFPLVPSSLFRESFCTTHPDGSAASPLAGAAAQPLAAAAAQPAAETEGAAARGARTAAAAAAAGAGGLPVTSETAEQAAAAEEGATRRGRTGDAAHPVGRAPAAAAASGILLPRVTGSISSSSSSIATSGAEETAAVACPNAPEAGDGTAAGALKRRDAPAGGPSLPVAKAAAAATNTTEQKLCIQLPQAAARGNLLVSVQTLPWPTPASLFSTHFWCSARCCEHQRCRLLSKRRHTLLLHPLLERSSPAACVPPPPLPPAANCLQSGVLPTAVAAADGFAAAYGAAAAAVPECDAAGSCLTLSPAAAVEELLCRLESSLRRCCTQTSSRQSSCCCWCCCCSFSSSSFTSGFPSDSSFYPSRAAAAAAVCRVDEKPSNTSLTKHSSSCSMGDSDKGNSSEMGSSDSKGSSGYSNAKSICNAAKASYSPARVTRRLEPGESSRREKKSCCCCEQRENERESVAVLFSGGVDSSLIAAVLCRLAVQQTIFSSSTSEAAASLPQNNSGCRTSSSTNASHKSSERFSLRRISCSRYMQCSSNLCNRSPLEEKARAAIGRRRRGVSSSSTTSSSWTTDDSSDNNGDSTGSLSNTSGSRCYEGDSHCWSGNGKGDCKTTSRSSCCGTRRRWRRRKRCVRGEKGVKLEAAVSQNTSSNRSVEEEADNGEGSEKQNSSRSGGGPPGNGGQEAEKKNKICKQQQERGRRKLLVELVNVAFTPSAPDRLTCLASYAELLEKLQRLRQQQLQQQLQQQEVVRQKELRERGRRGVPLQDSRTAETEVSAGAWNRRGERSASPAVRHAPATRTAAEAVPGGGAPSLARAAAGIRSPPSAAAADVSAFSAATAALCRPPAASPVAAAAAASVAASTAPAAHASPALPVSASAAAAACSAAAAAAADSGMFGDHLEVRLVCVDVAEEEFAAAEGRLLKALRPHGSHMDVNIAAALYFAARGKGYLVSPTFHRRAEWQQLRQQQQLWLPLQNTRLQQQVLRERQERLERQQEQRQQGAKSQHQAKGDEEEKEEQQQELERQPHGQEQQHQHQHGQQRSVFLRCSICALRSKKGCSHNACSLCCRKLRRAAAAAAGCPRTNAVNYVGEAADHSRRADTATGVARTGMRGAAGEARPAAAAASGAATAAQASTAAGEAARGRSAGAGEFSQPAAGAGFAADQSVAGAAAATPAAAVLRGAAETSSVESAAAHRSESRSSSSNAVTEEEDRRSGKVLVHVRGRGIVGIPAGLEQLHSRCPVHRDQRRQQHEAEKQQEGRTKATALIAAAGAAPGVSKDRCRAATADEVEPGAATCGAIFFTAAAPRAEAATAAAAAEAEDPDVTAALVKSAATAGLPREAAAMAAGSGCEAASAGLHGARDSSWEKPTKKGAATSRKSKAADDKRLVAHVSAEDDVVFPSAAAEKQRALPWYAMTQQEVAALHRREAMAFSRAGCCSGLPAVFVAPAAALLQQRPSRMCHGHCCCCCCFSCSPAGCSSCRSCTQQPTTDAGAAAGTGLDHMYSIESEVLLIGSGADELFGGYGRHKTARLKRGTEGLQEEMLLDLRRLWERNLGRDSRVGCHLAQRLLRLPFLDDEVISFVGFALPFSAVLSGEMHASRLALPQNAAAETAHQRPQEQQHQQQQHQQQTTRETPTGPDAGETVAVLQEQLLRCVREKAGQLQRQQVDVENNTPHERDSSRGSPPQQQQQQQERTKIKQRHQQGRGGRGRGGGAGEGGEGKWQREDGRSRLKILQQLVSQEQHRLCLQDKWLVRVCAAAEEMFFAAAAKKRAFQFGSRAAQLSNKRCSLSNRAATGTALYCVPAAGVDTRDEEESAAGHQPCRA